MAIPFQPKFVDLVRNSTTTTGTGNIVLGGAVAGFGSLATAVSVGEQFYYCIMGIDKPAEREVGRGTMMANGTVARQPIGGAATNFTSGTKTIALVVAAEWYDILRQLISGGPSDLSGLATSNKASLVAAVNEIAGTAAAAAVLTFASASGATINGNQVDTTGFAETGKGGARYVFSAAVDAAFVAANPRIAFMAAGGRGFRLDRVQPLTPQMVGAKADGVSDDFTPLQLWLDQGGELRLPAGHYHSTQRLLVRRQVNLRGDGWSFDARQPNLAAMAGSRISFAPGVGGLLCQMQTSESDTNVAVAGGVAAFTQEGAMHSHFEGFGLLGGGGAAATGFETRTVVTLRGIRMYGFAGRGFDVNASADVSDANSDYGNASLSSLDNCTAIQCGSHGFHVRGRDAGIVRMSNCNAQLNGGWGFVDDSTYGGGYYNCHAATNSNGSFKATSPSGSTTYDNCYVEGGTGEACDLSVTCQISGGNLAKATNIAVTPAPRFGFGKCEAAVVKLIGNQVFPGPVMGAGYVYHSPNLGLVLYGEGVNYDLYIANKNGDALMTAPSGSQDLNLNGNLGLASGKSLSVNGQAVVGARGAAVANATDAASAITQLNALLARCRAHGLIA